jgi:shikimate kinase
MNSENIILVGMAGVGKSTVGKLLSQVLGWDFVDLDEYIMHKNVKSIQDIINLEGEDAFAKIEKQSMYEIELMHKVVAPGGSIIYHPELMEYLSNRSIIVYLDDSFENIEKKLKDTPQRGILGLKNKTLEQIYWERKPLYLKFADIIVWCSGKSYEQITDEIRQKLLTRLH